MQGPGPELEKFDWGAVRGLRETDRRPCSWAQPWPARPDPGLGEAANKGGSIAHL